MNVFNEIKTYRHGTVLSSVFEQLEAAKIGETIILKAVDSFTGEKVKHSAVRMSATKVCQDHGMKIKTRVVEGELYAKRLA